MKKRWPLFALITCLSAGVTGAGVYAWLIDSKQTENTVHFVENEIHISEEFDPPSDPEPGDVIVKKPCIINDSEVEVFVRVSVRFTDSEAKEQCEPLVIKEGWNLEPDGYYYYDEKLGPKEKTQNIFDNIVIRETVKKEELIPFDVLIYAESVQAYGFSSAQEAFDEM